MLANSSALHELIEIFVMSVCWRCVFWNIFYRVLCGWRHLRTIAFGLRQVAVELFHAQVPQGLMSEKVLLCVVQEIVRIWIGGMPFNMSSVTWIPVRFLPKEARWHEHARSSAPYNVEAQQPVESHTNADGSRLQP